MRGRSAVGMLTAEEKKQYEKAKEIYDKMSMVDCTGCAYCMPCPFGLNIPELFKAYNTYGPEGKDGMKREYEESSRSVQIPAKLPSVRKGMPAEHQDQ